MNQSSSPTITTTSSTSSSHQCAICLDPLFGSSNCSRTTAATCAFACGHVFHRRCAKRHLMFSRAARRENDDDESKAFGCRCPLCNAPTESFLTLYLGSGDDSQNDIHEKEHNTNANANDSDNAINSLVDIDTPPIELEDILMAQQEHIRNKMKRYKRQNKSLKKELKAERQEMEEMLETAIQNIYKIVEKHEEERQIWSQGAMELRTELDRVLEQHAQERRQWNIEQQRMRQELEKVKQDCDTAEYRVQKAAEGLEELKMYNKLRQSKLNALLHEKSRLVHENRRLKHAVMLKTPASPVRADCLYEEC